MFYVVLFFVLFLVNISYYIVPEFPILFYENSAYFVLELSNRIDTLIIMVVFYVKTSIPLYFKGFLLAYSFVILFNIINIFPFENNNIGFYTFTCYVSAAFVIMWAFALTITKVQRDYFVQSFKIKLNKDNQNAFLLMLNEYEEMLKNKEITPREFLEVTKGIEEDINKEFPTSV